MVYWLSKYSKVTIPAPTAPSLIFTLFREKILLVALTKVLQRKGEFSQNSVKISLAAQVKRKQKIQKLGLKMLRNLIVSKLSQ